MSNSHKVIGYFAYLSGTPNVICDGPACLIAGSKQKMARYIQDLGQTDPKHCTIKKTRYGEIIKGMQHGGIYTFDEKSYSRFSRILATTGVMMAEFKTDEESRPSGHAIPLKQIQWIDCSS